MCDKVALASLPAGLVADAGFDPLAVIVARYGKGGGFKNVGEGAKASLAAFEYLLSHEVVESEQESEAA